MPVGHRGGGAGAARLPRSSNPYPILNPNPNPNPDPNPNPNPNPNQVYLAPGTPMYSVQRTRNTHVGHTGQMASWQMRGVPFALEAEAPRRSPDVVEA